MAKRNITDQLKDNSMIGYLHNVSTITTSSNGRTKYFCGTFQTSKTDVKRLVSFQPEKHDKYSTAAAMISPVKITESRLSPGRNGQNEILCDKNTTLELLNDELPFKKQKVDNTEDQMSEPKNVSDLTGEKMTATLYDVKLIKFLEDKKLTNTRYGVKTTRNAVLADNTKAITITFWQNCVDAVEQEKIYKFTNCITTSFNNEIWINTTSNSKITEIEPFGEVKDSSNLLQASSSKIELALVSVTQHKKCSNVKCNKSITLDSSVPDPTFNCKHCLMKQKTANIKTATVVVMNTESQSYTMYDSALKTFLEGESRLDLLQDADRLEDFLLEIENFEVTHNQNDHIIISLSRN